MRIYKLKVLNWTLAACLLNDNGNSRANPRLFSLEIDDKMPFLEQFCVTVNHANLCLCSRVCGGSLHTSLA